MITPKDMERFTNNEVVNMYEQLNQRLAKTIITQLRKGGDISSFTRSQINSLARTGGKEVFNKALERTSKLTFKQKKQIRKLFDDILETELNGYKTTYEKQGLNYGVSEEMVNIVDYAIRTSNRDLKNLTKSVAYKTKREYIKAVDELYKDVVSGGYDYNTALKRTIKKVAEKGITLKTSDGRNEQIDVAVKRNLFTGIQQTANDLAKQIGKEIDANCVKIGHSSKCRPSHHVIDGVTMSLKEFEKYEYLTEEYNCNHIVNYDWEESFEGTTAKVESHDDRLSYSDTIKNYKKLQKANYYARQVRSKKDAIASGNNDKKSQLQLRLAQKKYREYCKQNKFEVDYSKTWKVGYNK